MSHAPPPRPRPLWRHPAVELSLAAVLAALAFLLARPYVQYGLDAAHIDEMDPFRIAHGATLSIPNAEVYKGAEKDQIPALTEPAFTPAAAAPAWLTDDRRVIGVVHDGVAKAYPTLILLWHEAVNDTVAGKPYLVTY